MIHTLWYAMHFNDAIRVTIFNLIVSIINIIGNCFLVASAFSKIAALASGFALIDAVVVCSNCLAALADRIALPCCSRIFFEPDYQFGW